MSVSVYEYEHMMLHLYFTISDAMHMRAYGQSYSAVNVLLFKLCYLLTVQCLLVDSVCMLDIVLYFIFTLISRCISNAIISVFCCHKSNLERHLGVLYLDKNISTSICSLLPICYLQLSYEFLPIFDLGKDDPSTFPTSKT